MTLELAKDFTSGRLKGSQLHGRCAGWAGFVDHKLEEMKDDQQ
jgi:hypothetical protein